MSTPPPIVFRWTGKAMAPIASRLAEQSYTAGHTYRLIVAEERQRSNRRSLDQNARMWAMLGEISEQVEHCGRKYSPDQWKCLFLHACGQEISFLPALDNQTFVPWGLQSSSRLTKAEMSELIEFMLSWGVQNGVTFRDQEEAA